MSDNSKDRNHHKISTFLLVFIFGLAFASVGVSSCCGSEYGEVFFHNDGIAAIVEITDNITYFNFTNFTSGELFGFTLLNDNSTLQSQTSGLFSVTYSISMGGARQEYQVVVKINDVVKLNTESHRTVANIGDQGHVGGTGFVRIYKNDNITLGIKNKDTPVSDADVTSVNLNVLKVSS